MKKPSKPNPPTQPVEPNKTMYVKNTLRYLYRDEDVNLADLLDGIDPKDYSKITIRVDISPGYYGDIDNDSKVFIEEEVDNPDYDRELKKYKVALTKYNEDKKKYDAAMEKYEKDLKVWQSWAKTEETRKRREQFEKLKKEFEDA